MSSLREYDVNSRAFSVAGYELRRSMPCKTSPLVEARVLIASGEWWIKVSWALHSHRNCIKGSSVLFIFVRCRWSRDLRNTCEKRPQVTPSSTTGAFILDMGPAFSFASCAVFYAVLSLGWRTLKVFAICVIRALLMRGSKRGSPWMHEWVFDWNCCFTSQVLAVSARAHRNEQKFAALSTRALISISIS